LKESDKLSKFSSVTIKGKEYKREIVGYDSLTLEQRKKLKQLPHLWKSGYCGSIIEGNTILEVYKPLSRIDVLISSKEEDKELKELEEESWEQIYQYEDEEAEEENC